MDTIVFDIETKYLFRDIGKDRSKLPQLGVSVVGTYCYKSDQYKVYREEELNELEALFKQAGQIVGYNSNGFDIPVLFGHIDFDFSSVRSTDLMDDMKQVIHKRVSLNHVAKATLGFGKTGDGLAAVNLYHEGKWKELEAYCLDDVRITKELFDFGRKHRYVQIYTTYGLEKKKIPVQWHLADEISDIPSTTQTLLL